MKKTKIDWCDSTINCVYGCPNNCEYCYGNVMNNRFHFCKDWKVPEWKPKHLKDFYSKKPKSIFIDSMSDIGAWKGKWIMEVLKAMLDNPQHKYIALTKCNLQRTALNWHTAKEVIGASQIPLFWGKSVTTQSQVNALKQEYTSEYLDFLSIEPILEPLDLSFISPNTTLIIGAETGNRKGKVIPQKEWIDSLVRQADKHNCVVFMKGSLRKIMGDDFRQDKLPWEIEQ